MSRMPRRPDVLVGKIFRGSAVINEGLLTAGDLRSSAWQPLFRGVYADQAVTITHQMRCLVVSNYLLPKGAAVAGRSAASIYGAPTRAVYDAVEVLTPRPFGPVKGLTIHRGDLSDDDIRRSGKLVMTTPLRTCWDLARWLDTAETVAALDVLVASRKVTVAEMLAYAGARSEQPGWSRLLRAARLVDAASESPQESRLRVKLILAGLPRPACQFNVIDDGQFIARVDFAWEKWKIALEYDGAWHAERQQLERDRARLNKLVSAGWIVLHVTSQRMHDDFDGIVRELRTAIRRRR